MAYKPVQAPLTFNGEKFMKKYGVKPEDFRIYKGELYCETLPDLNKADLADCIDVVISGIDEATLDFIRTQGKIYAYPDGDENQKAIYASCIYLEQQGIITSSSMLPGQILFQIREDKS